MEKKQALCVLSFGTSFPDTCEKTIKAIEQDLQKVFPQRKFYRAWTSGFIRRKILERDGEKILSPEEALEQMAAEGITDVLMQPTHLLEGAEFKKIQAALEKYHSHFPDILTGKPLLTREEDIEEMAERLLDVFRFIPESDMLVLMGHGSEELKFPVYGMLEQSLMRHGRGQYAVGTVEFSPGIMPVLEKIRKARPKKVWLAPLLVVAGDHVLHDMAGEDLDSWKNRIAAEGMEVECILKGLGEYPQIREMYVHKAQQTQS